MKQPFENHIKIPFAHSLGLKGEGKHSCGFRRGGWRSTVRRRAFAVKIGGGLEKEKRNVEKDLGRKRSGKENLLSCGYIRLKFILTATSYRGIYLHFNGATGRFNCD